MNKVYVTYSKRSLIYGDKTRYAVQCRDMEQAYWTASDLNSRVGITNVRINKCGRGLPEEAKVFSFAEYANAELR